MRDLGNLVANFRDPCARELRLHVQSIACDQWCRVHTRVARPRCPGLLDNLTCLGIVNRINVAIDPDDSAIVIDRGGNIGFEILAAPNFLAIRSNSCEWAVDLARAVDNPTGENGRRTCIAV